MLPIKAGGISKERRQKLNIVRLCVEGSRSSKPNPKTKIEEI